MIISLTNATFIPEQQRINLKITATLTKLYYTISEVAEMFDVNNSLIRYWEKEFKSLKPQKNRKGDRKFMVKDIEEIARIYTLVKENGYTIDGAKKALGEAAETEAKNKNLLKKLESLKKNLKSLSSGL